MVNITPDPNKIEIISPPKSLLAQWWSSWRGRVGITAATLEGLRRIYEGILWLLDLPGRSDQAMTWTHHLANVLKHLPHLSQWVDVGLFVVAFVFLYWDNRRRHRRLLPEQLTAKALITDLDPQVMLEIKNQEFPDDLELHTPYNRPLIFDNRGKRDAMRVRVEMGKLNEGWAECEEISIIKHDEKQLLLPHIKDSSGKDMVPFQEYSLEELLQAEWQHRKAVDQLAGAQKSILPLPTTISVPVKITYQDHNENKFSTQQTMIYYFFKDGVKGYIEFTAPKFTRL